MLPFNHFKSYCEVWWPDFLLSYPPVFLYLHYRRNLYGARSSKPLTEYFKCFQDVISTDFSEPTCVITHMRECQKSASGKENVVILHTYKKWDRKEIVSFYYSVPPAHNNTVKNNWQQRPLISLSMHCSWAGVYAKGVTLGHFRRRKVITWELKAAMTKVWKIINDKRKAKKTTTSQPFW